jgi:hypothetical protein
VAAAVVQWRMTMKRITRREFDQLLPRHSRLEELMGAQVEWYANSAQTLIGTIALTAVGRSWNYAILRRNRLGTFQVCDVADNFFSRRQTVAQFHHAAAAAKRYPQDVSFDAD